MFMAAAGRTRCPMTMRVIQKALDSCSCSGSAGRHCGDTCGECCCDCFFLQYPYACPCAVVTALVCLTISASASGRPDSWPLCEVRSGPWGVRVLCSMRIHTWYSVSTRSIFTCAPYPFVEWHTSLTQGGHRTSNSGVRRRHHTSSHAVQVLASK